MLWSTHTSGRQSARGKAKVILPGVPFFSCRRAGKTLGKCTRTWVMYYSKLELLAKVPLSTNGSDDERQIKSVSTPKEGYLDLPETRDDL